MTTRRELPGGVGARRPGTDTTDVTHRVGGAAEVPALQPHAVVRAQAREQGAPSAPKVRGAGVPAADRQPLLLRGVRAHRR
ncbi:MULTISPECIES: hypothetical protein [Streptomyces]|uniref:hypothetical protein n=1 Tax=Streptomyces TaxID=1883 RepID=UPI000A5F3E9C|nr:hypothetical protein [Streptomyces sp. MUM 16J]